METLRTFIALEFDSRTLAWLGEFREALAGRHPRVRWVKPEHLHLTLKFLGQVPHGRIESICEVCDTVSQGTGPFSLLLGSPGHFGHRRAPQTFWVGFLPNPELEVLGKLERRLEASLEPLGFPAEDRPWTPHITLGRNPRGVRTEGWEELCPPWPSGGVPAMVVEELRLYSSDLTAGGPHHQVLWKKSFQVSSPAGESSRP